MIFYENPSFDGKKTIFPKKIQIFEKSLAKIAHHVL